MYVILFVIAVAAMIIPFLFQRPEWLGLAPIILFIEYGYQNNQMMIYVEKHLYGQDTIHE